jgi:hypothetical protein
MSIVEDHAAIGTELRRIQAQRRPQQTAIVVPRGVLRVPLSAREAGTAPNNLPTDSVVARRPGAAVI